MSLFNLLYEHNLALWHLARDQISSVNKESPEWWLLFHEQDRLVGCCLQMAVNGSIREEDISQLIAFPALDDTGPHAAWIAQIRAHQPRLFTYVTTLEVMRLALLKEISKAP